MSCNKFMNMHKLQNRMVMDHEDGENIVTSIEFSFTAIMHLKHPDIVVHTSQNLLCHQVLCFLASQLHCILQALLRWKISSQLIYRFVLAGKIEA
jgi:hypothetical protein